MKRLLVLMLLFLMSFQSAQAAMSRAEAFLTLGLPQTATEAEIKKAYKQLALRYHSDKPTADPVMFRRVKEASEVLLATGTTFQSESASAEYPRDLKRKYSNYLHRIDETVGELDAMKKLCNDTTIKYSTDPEIKNICLMVPIIEKISKSQPLTFAEKKLVINDAPLNSYYDSKQTDVVNKVDEELGKPMKHTPEYFYLSHENTLDLFTPGTSPQILKLYSDAIAEYTRRKEYNEATQIAKRAQSKAQALEKEIRDLGIVSTEFNDALAKLNQTIVNIEQSKNPQAEAQRRQQEEQERKRREQQEAAERAARQAEEQKKKAQGSGATSSKQGLSRAERIRLEQEEEQAELDALFKKKK